MSALGRTWILVRLLTPHHTASFVLVGLTMSVLRSSVAVRSALFTPFCLTDISEGDWLHSLQHFLQVGCVVGQTAADCKKGVGSCREGVEGVDG